jgi:PAS domain S-box-containing protein
MNGHRSIIFMLHERPWFREKSAPRSFQYLQEQIARSMSEITKKSDEQKDAAAEVESFRKDLGPFVVAAETTRMAMVFTDAKEADNPIIFANDSFLSLTGYSREEVLGKSFNFLMANGADAEALTRTKAELEGSPGSGRKFSAAARMEASSGPLSSSVRFATTAVTSFNILHR